MEIGPIDLVPFIAALLGAGLMRAIPLTLAALGEAVGERAGLLNLGIEGMMLAGCFFGFWAGHATGSTAAGIAGGIAAGLALALLSGVLTITFGVDQVLVGLGLTIFGGGLSAFLFRDVFEGKNVAAGVTPLVISIPGVRELPIVGSALFDREVVFFLGWALVPIFAWGLARTRPGLMIRACGEPPVAGDAAGVNVALVRYAAMLVAGGMAGFAGAFLCVVDVGVFNVGMTVGQGFIAIALTMLGRWNPWRIAAGAMLFGMMQTLGDQLQIQGVDVQTEAVGMLPYLAVMVALALFARRALLPAALGVPYRRGERA
jgi:general nucleoside transport system permease protein